MATNYPANLDSFLNPGPLDLLDSATAALEHDHQHSNANDAIEALQRKLGVDESNDFDSVDFRLRTLEGIRWGTARAVASAPTVATGTYQDVSGAVVNFETWGANAWLVIVGVLDMSANGTSDVGTGQLIVDGIAQPGQIISQVLRGTVSQVWRVQVALSGSHQAKLQVAKVGAANVVTAMQTHSTLTVLGEGVTQV